MKKINLLPNVVTAFGLVCGLFVIFQVNLADESPYTMLTHMTLILLLAALADLIDGALARAIHAESEFGVLLDSLADAISFGVAPSVLLLKALALPKGELLGFYALGACMLYTVCGVFRLVRFNVSSGLSKKSEEKGGKKTFIGLPIPAAMGASMAPNLLLHSPNLLIYSELSQTLKSIILSSIMIVIGYLMISRFRFPSLKSIHFKVPSLQLIFFATILALFLLYGLLYYLPFLLLIVFWGYIIIGLLLGFIRKVRGKKTKVLEDYEPSDDD